MVWIAYAAEGNPLCLIGIFSTAVVLALITLQLTERAFIEGTQHLTESVVSARPGTADAPFQIGHPLA